MRPAPPIVRDLVLVGGGHSHVAVLKRFGMRPLPGVRLTLVAREVHTPYSGMLPGLVAGHYEFDEAHIDLEPLARFAGARLVRAAATGLDLEARRLELAGRPSIRYDLLSLDIGATPDLDAVPGAAEHAVPVKPIGRFLERWDALLARVDEGVARVATVGAGAGGVELLLAVHRRLLDRLGPDRLPRFDLFSAGPIVPAFPRRARRLLERALAERGVEVHRQAIERVEPGPTLVDARGERWSADEVLWVTHARGARWPGAAGLAVDARGFVQVDDTLRSVSHPEVFAAGDIATQVNHPRPKAGVFAVRQGPPLAANLRRALLGQPLRPHRPQRHFLTLVGTGDERAVAARGPFALEGAWLWRLKDRIDRRFMAKYADLPKMEPEAPALPKGLEAPEVRRQLAEAPMRCGGCGAKVGATVLEQALRRLGLPSDPEDAALVEPPAGEVLLYSADQLRPFLDDPLVFGRVVAHHALNDLHAMGATPRTALALATVPFGPDALVVEEVHQLLAGALQVFEAHGVRLVGGHTGEGETALGFAVHGSAPREALLPKGGLRPGQRLVLTRGLGTGVLFAAAMRGEARGRWIEAALAGMQRSNADAAACLRDHGATACTDVTGFGLMGHLHEMLRAASASARLHLDAVPLLPGARALAEAGVRSSLAPQNLRLRRTVEADPAAASDPRFALLFDPQTAGGLLAGLPPARAAACVAALRRLGHADAAVVGAVEAASPDEVGVRVELDEARAAR